MALRILIALLILAVPLELPGCGPFIPQALYMLKGRPENPAEFAQGKLGILQPTYDRQSLFLAYRYLAGIGLNAAEQAAALAPPDPNRPDSKVWIEARRAATGQEGPDQIDPYRQVQRQGYFDSYLNCNQDAFNTAAATLHRIQLTGKTADWIAAQDLVFANCSKGTAIPQPTSDAQLRPDRAYQIASAKFYAEQYDAAQQDFAAIAADSSSSWRGVAPYLAARCLVRAGKLAEAEAALRKIAADPALAKWRTPANGLMGYVNAKLHPAGRMHELAVALVQRDSQATIGQNLTDYRWLFDRSVTPQPADDLSDWILSYQIGSAGAVDRWRAGRTLPWLVAAMQTAHRGDAALAELMAAAEKVPADSPAYLTVNYQRMRLMDSDDARSLAERLLAGTIPPSAANQIRAQRMKLARDFTDFLRFAPRRPVARQVEEIEPFDGAGEYLDSDATDVLDYQLPLTRMKEAAGSPMLPEHVRQDLLRAVAVRTLVLSASPDFDAVFALLHEPGERPYIASGLGRFTRELNKIDDYRDNWWCGPPTVGGAKEPAREAAFLSEAEREQARQEVEKLRMLAAAPDWMGALTLAFAEAHPQDRRVAEALSLVVRATRYGCTGAQNGDTSKRAFDLLHRRYPDSDWAKKTPYWYK